MPICKSMQSIISQYNSSPPGPLILPRLHLHLSRTLSKIDRSCPSRGTKRKSILSFHRFLLPLHKHLCNSTGSKNIKMPNTIAYFDITIANEPAGRLIFELFDDVVPKVRLIAAFSGHHTCCLKYRGRSSLEAGTIRVNIDYWVFCRLSTTLSTSVSETRPTKPVSSSLMPDPASTGVLKVSCCKAVTLPGVMEPVESPFTAKRLVGIL